MSRFLFLTLVTVFLMLAGCNGRFAQTTVLGTDDDLSQNPSLLLRRADSSTLSLEGIRIGDPASRVQRDETNPSSDPAWIITRSGNRFRVDAGQVVTLGLWNSAALDKLGVNTEADVKKIFGPPDSIDEQFHFYGGTFKAYRYASKKMTVIWNSFEDRLVGVNLTK